MRALFPALPLAAFPLAALLLAACGPPAPDEGSPEADRLAREAEGAATRTVDRVRRSISDRSGDLDVGTEVPGEPVETITTRGGALDLGVTDAALFSRLSPQARKEAQEEMDRAAGEQEGVGGAVARIVTEAVAEGLDTAVIVPLDRVAAVRYADGRLVVEMVSGEPSPFDAAESDGEPMLTRFDPDDARRLVEAFDRVRSVQ